MGIGLAFRGFAYSFLTNASLGIAKRIAVDRSGRIPIGTSRGTVDFTCALVCEMKTCDTRGDDTRSVLTDAGRSVVCRVTVQTLRAAMCILINTGIVIKTFVAGTRADDTLPILTKCIVRALRTTLAAVQWVTLELVLRQTHRLRVGTAIDHASLACIGTISLTAATGLGRFLIRTYDSAGTAVTEIAAMNVDADVLLSSSTKRVLRILTRCQDAFSADTPLELRTGNITAARYICPTEIPARHGIDAGTAAKHFARFAFALALTFSTDLIRFALFVDRSACIVFIFRTDRSFGIVLVKQTFEVITGCACFGKTALADTPSGFPPVVLSTVIGMCAAMGHIIGFALVCKEMFCVAAFDFVGIARSCSGIAQSILCTCLRDFPFPGHTFRKCTSVTFPCIVCTLEASTGIARSSSGITQCICCTCLRNLPFPGHTFRKCTFVTFPGVVCTLGSTTGIARSSSGIAHGICCTCLRDFPFPGHAFRKYISITFPGVVCTLEASTGIARSCFRIALGIIFIRRFRTCTDCQGA